MPAATNAPYLRATVSGRSRYADLVLPTDEPVSLLVPQLLTLLDEPQDLGQVHLATSLGRVLDPAVPLGGTDLVDGVRLHLVTAHDLPPAPLVHDLADVVQASSAPGRWTESHRTTTLAVLGGALVGAAVVAALRILDGFDGTVALVVAGLLLALSAGAAALRAPAFAWVTAVLGVGTGALVLQRTETWQTSSTLLLVGLVAAALVATGWCTRQLVAGLVSVVTFVGLCAVAALTWMLTDDLVRTAAVVATGTVLAVGVLPRIALAASGVFALDGRVADGDDVTPVNAEDAVARAHWTLTGAALVSAAVFLASAYLLGRDSGVQPWPAGLTAVVSGALALRARHFPLALHRGALWAGALAGPMGLVVAAERRWPDAGPLLVAGLAAAGIAVAVAAVVRLSPLQRARSRRRANQLETSLIVLSVPTVLGVFAVYQDLLRTFQ